MLALHRVKTLNPKKIEEYVDALPSDEIMQVNDLTKYFPLRRGLIEALKRKPPLQVKAVDKSSFDIKFGEVFGLVGETGCGKTTAGKVIIRLYNPTSGGVIFKPRDEVLKELQKISGGSMEQHKGYIDVASLPTKSLRSIRKEMQMIFQDPYGALDPRFKVRALLEEPLLLHKIGDTKEERENITADALEDVKMTPPEEFMERYPHMLSGGQRQRVSLARTLILHSHFIVADEPVSMIDVSLRAGLLELMVELKKEHDITYLFITHDLTVARYLCNRIAVMYLGKTVEMAKSREIIEDPLHPYTRALVAAIPEPDPSNRDGFRYVPIKGEIPNAVNIPRGCRFHPRCVERDEHPEIKEKCTTEEPPYIEAKPGHYVACWLHR
jgi:peptide/nickel transport system ATP-binding protein